MTISFFLIGLSLTFAVWVLQRRSWSIVRRATVIVGTALIGGFLGVIFFVTLSMDPIYLGENDLHWFDKAPMREIILLLLMMLGMAARYLTGVIEERRDRIRQLQSEGRDANKVPIRFDMWEFTYPLLFSVVTFGALLGQLEGDGLTVPNAIISFQTGFFWQTVLKREESVRLAAGA